MNELQIFNNEEFGRIRTVEIDRKPYFVANDVARALGYATPKDAVSRHCKGALKRRYLTEGGKQEMKIIPEGDMYRLITHSKLESAERFESWVFDEVLPTLRKTGSYEMPKKKQSNERLASVNNAVKILTPMLQAAGCNSKIQLLTAKSLYEKAGVNLPIMIEADQQYFDTIHIARRQDCIIKAPVSRQIRQSTRSSADWIYQRIYTQKLGNLKETGRDPSGNMLRRSLTW